MSDRQAILAKICDSADSADSADSLESGALAFAPPDFAIALPQPDYGFDIEANKTDQFTAMLTQAHGSWEIVENLSHVPASAIRYLTKAGADLHAAIAPDEKLTRLEWGDMAVEARAAQETDHTSITMAFAGIAETGTIAMLSSAQSPTTLNFLPEINIVVLPKARLLATVEQFWPKLHIHSMAQPETQPQTSHRAINFITGPSKTADIEQTIVYGAHGPRHFHVIIVKNQR